MIYIKERWRHLRKGAYELSKQSEKLAIESGKAIPLDSVTTSHTLNQIHSYMDLKGIEYGSETKQELIDKIADVD